MYWLQWHFPWNINHILYNNSTHRYLYLAVVDGFTRSKKHIYLKTHAYLRRKSHRIHRCLSKRAIPSSFATLQNFSFHNGLFFIHLPTFQQICYKGKRHFQLSNSFSIKIWKTWWGLGKRGKCPTLAFSDVTIILPLLLQPIAVKIPTVFPGLRKVAGQCDIR